jgi:lysophospholipase L1-like esterase
VQQPAKITRGAGRMTAGPHLVLPRPSGAAVSGLARAASAQARALPALARGTGSARSLAALLRAAHRSGRPAPAPAARAGRSAARAVRAALAFDWAPVITEADRQRIRTAGRIAGGLTGGAAAAAGLSLALLVRQAADARRIIPMAEAPPPRADGLYGPKFPGKPLTMVVLGDSSAAGYGVHKPRETPGALLATGVSRRLRRPVRLHRLAVVGSVSAGLPYQVEAALDLHPDVAVILVGGNDVTHVSARASAVRHLADAVRRLRATGCRVVVGTCPDLGAIQPIKPPLRWLARTWSRQLAAAQTVAVVEAGGRTVSIGDLLGKAFEADPARMFSSDRFHPSAEGYARAAAVMMPTLMAVLGEDDRTPAARTETLRTLPQAAHEAVRAAGTEVSPTEVNGRERGPAGRWAQLRRHPWFGEQRPWFGYRAAGNAQGAADTVPRGRSAPSPVGWTPEDHQPAT